MTFCFVHLDVVLKAITTTTLFIYCLFLEDASLSTATCFGSVSNHPQAIYVGSLRKLLYLQRIRCLRFNLFSVIYNMLSL
jgi:hypothetical protein